MPNIQCTAKSNASQRAMGKNTEICRLFRELRPIGIPIRDGNDLRVFFHNPESLRLYAIHGILFVIGQREAAPRVRGSLFVV